MAQGHLGDSEWPALALLIYHQACGNAGSGGRAPLTEDGAQPCCRHIPVSESRTGECATRNGTFRVSMQCGLRSEGGEAREAPANLAPWQTCQSPGGWRPLQARYREIKAPQCDSWQAGAEVQENAGRAAQTPGPCRASSWLSNGDPPPALASRPPCLPRPTQVPLPGLSAAHACSLLSQDGGCASRSGVHPSACMKLHLPDEAPQPSRRA